MTRINDEELKHAVQVINEAIVAVRERGGDVIINPQANRDYGICVNAPIKITYFIPLETGEEPKNEQHG